MANSRNISIDLGNNNAVLGFQNEQFISEPSVVALLSKDKSYKAFGTEARKMVGKVNGHLKVVRPLKAGVIADLDAATKLLKGMVDKSLPKRSFMFSLSKVLSSVPYSSTEVERRALRVAISQFSAKHTSLIYSPLAAAIGMGLNIREPEGKFVIDIGGGLTEIALISLSGIVTYDSVKVGGDTFNYDIKNYLERSHLLSISEETAEYIKLNIGAATELESPSATCEAVGKDIITGIPRSITLESGSIAFILNDSITRIETAIHKTLEICPPELASDIYLNGIYLTGGGSLLKGLKERLQASLKLDVILATEPQLSVAHGLKYIQDNDKEYRNIQFK